MSKFCKDCGFKNPDTAKFCSACGEPVTVIKEHNVEDYVLKKGSILGGRYIIEEFIKVGGMGAVYRATDKNLEKLCAVKELRPSWITSEQGSEYFIKKFELEAKLLSQLHHTGLPGVIDYFVEQEKSYLIMDFIEGFDLNTLLIKRGNPGLPEKKVIEWGIEICEVLEYLHNHTPPVIYRDLKPSNVMIKSSDGRAVLIDFGIVCVMEGTGQTTRTTIGTMGYIAPEQYLGKPCRASDIYSLGATMYYLLSSTMPVPFGEYRSIIDVAPQISQSVDRILCRALKRKLKERYQKIEDIKKDLKNAIAGLLNSPEMSEISAPLPDSAEIYMPEEDNEFYDISGTDAIQDERDTGEMEDTGELDFMEEEITTGFFEERAEDFIQLDMELLKETGEEEARKPGKRGKKSDIKTDFKYKEKDKIARSLLEELLNKKDLGALIPLLLVNKESLDKRFFEILDYEMDRALKKNKKRSDDLAYLNRILINLKIRDIRASSDAKSKASSKGLDKKELAKKYFNDAQNLIVQKKFNEVIKACKKALKFDEEFLEVYYTLGSVYKKVNRPDLVIENYKKYLALKQKKVLEKVKGKRR